MIEVAGAIGEAGQRIMMSEIGHLRLGAAPFRDIDGCDENGRGALVHDRLREDGNFDLAAVALQVRPVLIAKDARRGAVELFDVGMAFGGMQALHGPADHLFARISIVFTRGGVGGQDRLAGLRDDVHGHGVGFEQKAEGGFALLQFGDVDAQADDAAVGRPAFVDQNAAAVRQPLLVASGRGHHLLEALGDPVRLHDRSRRDSHRARRRRAACRRGVRRL